MSKLVRDRIPELIRARGARPSFHQAREDEKLALLDAKLREEVDELMTDRTCEELADVLEVVFAIARHLGYAESAVLHARDDKRERRGGFDAWVVLDGVQEPPL